MIKLDPTLHQFPTKYFGSANDFLSSKGSPDRDILMIACSDQGTAPDHLSCARSERFLILQHIASSVRPADHQAKHAPATDIEFAFWKYNIKHVIVCGHLNCGVIPNWLSNRHLEEAKEISDRFQQTTLRAVNETYPACTGKDRVKAVIYEHTLFQVENLCSHPFILDKLESAELHLHAWIVNDETARVREYDPSQGWFTSI